MHISVLSAALLWNVKKCAIFIYWFFFIFFASGFRWAVAGHKERKDRFLLLFANIWSKALFHNICHFQGQAVVVVRNLLQLAKSALQFLKNSFPLSNQTMDLSRCSSRFVMSNVTKGYGGNRLNPRWEQMCAMVAQQTVWIGMIIFTHTHTKRESEKNNWWKKCKTLKRCCFCSHSYFSRLLSDLPCLLKPLHLGACRRWSFTHRRCKGVSHTWLQFLSFHLELSEAFAGNGDLIFTQPGPCRCLPTWPRDQYHFSCRWNVYRGPICSHGAGWRNTWPRFHFFSKPARRW